MTQIAHVKNTNGTWNFVKRFNLGQDGTAEGEVRDGPRVLLFQPFSGWVSDDGLDRVVDIVETTIDNSTANNTRVLVTVSPPTWNGVSNTIDIVTVKTDDIITNSVINEERDRRILEPKTVYLSSGKSFVVDMKDGGRENIIDLGSAALAKISIGNTDTISFRDANNTDWDLTNIDIIEMGLQIMEQVEAIHIKCRAIKANSNIQWNFDDDSFWV